MEHSFKVLKVILMLRYIKGTLAYIGGEFMFIMVIC